MSRPRLGRVLMWVLRLFGAALIVYAPLAIFGPVQELSTPNGPLHCDGSALSLRNRHSIPSNPQRNDCRSQAEDQTSGAIASFFVGVAIVAGPPVIVRLHRRWQRARVRRAAVRPADEPWIAADGRHDSAHPEVSRRHARRLVASLAVFWGGIGIVSRTIDGGFALAVFLVAFAAGWCFFITLFDIWGVPMFVIPGRGYFAHYRRSNRVVWSLFRPSFVGRIFVATGWPPTLVGAMLAACLGAAIVSGITADVPQRPCDSAEC